jgi:ABC-2 type transport system permease protein
LAAALAIPGERDNGLLSRFWLMPVHRASALTGTLLAEAARTFVATVLITGIGVLLGLRFEAGILAALLFILIPVAWVTVYATIVLVVALKFQNRTMLTWLNTFSLGAVFGSSGVAPMELFPGWLQPIIRAQPMSPTIESMRGLARDGFAAGPLLWTFAWIVGVGLIVGTMAVRSYRTAAQSG